MPSFYLTKYNIDLEHINKRKHTEQRFEIISNRVKSLQNAETKAGKEIERINLQLEKFNKIRKDHINHLAETQKRAIEKSQLVEFVYYTIGT